MYDWHRDESGSRVDLLRDHYLVLFAATFNLLENPSHMERMIDYDDIDDWAPYLSEVLAPIVSDKVRGAVAAQVPECLEDSRIYLFTLVAREKLITAVLQWLEANTVVAYHGSRLTQEEVGSVQLKGLLPLVGTARRARLARALAKHPDWDSAKARLDDVIRAYGFGNMGGSREGQVHLTLSLAGLENGFDHYLRYGSEFDQHVAHELLGPSGKDCLADDGVAIVVKVALSGKDALAGAHPFFSIADVLEMGDTPNLVREFIDAWSHRLYDSCYQTRTRALDSGIWFREAVPPSCILSMQFVDQL